MNFEPCNPPLIDFQFLSEMINPKALLQQLEDSRTLKTELNPLKVYPVRPIPIRPSPGHVTPNVTITTRSNRNTLTPSPDRRSPTPFKPIVRSEESPCSDVTTSPGDVITPRSTPPAAARKTPYRRNDRQGISGSQLSVLKDWFERYTYLTVKDREIVSELTELPAKTVMYWFQNQRRKVKRQRSAKS